MTLQERQDKERKALINEILLSDPDNLEEILSLREALKQVTEDPENYFKIIDKEDKE